MNVMNIYVVAIAIMMIGITIIPAIFTIRMVKNMIGTVTIICVIVITTIPPGAIIVSVPVV